MKPSLGDLLNPIYNNKIMHKAFSIYLIKFVG